MKNTSCGDSICFDCSHFFCSCGRGSGRSPLFDNYNYKIRRCLFLKQGMGEVIQQCNHFSRVVETICSKRHAEIDGISS